MQPLKKELSQDIDWSMVDKEDYLLAMERSLKKGVELKYLLKAAHTDNSYDQEVYRKGIDTSYYYEGYIIYRAKDLS
ncbi:cell filamentation protein [[Clostridium] innocuum]|nr:cell filamentation protein [[Clostridium] innocuum]